MATPAPPAAAAGDSIGVESALRWRVPDGQRFVFEDFDDGIVMYDTLVGSTHLISVTAAETLALVSERSGMTAAELYRALLARTGVDEIALPFPAVRELLWQLEHLNLLAADPP